MADAPRRRRRIARSALLAVALVGLLFVFVYPTRTFLDQRHETQQAEAQLALLQGQRAQLQAQAKSLTSDAEVIRIARERYGLVKPGEIPFVILPTPATSPAASTTTTTTPPSTAKPVP